MNPQQKSDYEFFYSTLKNLIRLDVKMNGNRFLGVNGGPEARQAVISCLDLLSERLNSDWEKELNIINPEDIERYRR